MQKLLALSIKSAVVCMLSLSFTSVALATEDDLENEELSYTAELRRDAVNSAKKLAPTATFEAQTEILNEDDRKALANATKEDLGRINSIKPAFSKPTLSQPLSN